MPFDGEVTLYLKPAPVPVETGPQRIIREARAMLSSEAAWCKGHFKYETGAVTAHCILGALRVAAGGNPYRAGTGGASRFVARAVKARGFSGIQTFNDSFSTHAQMIEVLDRAYEMAGR